MPVNGQVVIPQGQGTRTMMMAAGPPQKDCVLHPKSCESAVLQAGSQIDEWVRGNCVRAGPARGGLLEEIACFNSGLWSEKDVGYR